MPCPHGWAGWTDRQAVHNPDNLSSLIQHTCEIRATCVCVQARGDTRPIGGAHVFCWLSFVTCVCICGAAASEPREREIEREATNVGDIGIKLMCSLCSYSHGWFFVRNEFGFEFRKTCCVHRPLALWLALLFSSLCVFLCVFLSCCFELSSVNVSFVAHHQKKTGGRRVGRSRSDPNTAKRYHETQPQT